MESAHDLIASLAASTQDVDKGEPQAVQDCHDRLKIALFFDGTGNNRAADAAAKKWSNVARLFDASRNDPANGIYSYYISGIGTALNRDEPWWRVSKIMRDTTPFGASSGWGADVRLESGDLNMNDMLKRALQIASSKAGEDVKRIYERNESKGFEDLNRALGNHRLIKSIEVSIFGFSRGAALARAFVNRLLKLCSSSGGTLTYESYPITFRFLGIFDTVASFGRPAKNDYEAVDLWLPAQLQRCVHYVAAHEIRYSFPVDLIRQGGAYPNGWTEEVYPGVHSNVGGGYAPEEQGRSDALSRVPLVAMYRESMLGGVRLSDWKTVSGDVLLKNKFVVPPSVQASYDAYMSSLGAAATSGAIEHRMQAHMKSWYAYKRAVTGAQSPDDAFYQQRVGTYEAEIEDLNTRISGIMRNELHSDDGLYRARKLAEERDGIQARLRDLQDGKGQVDGGQSEIAEEADDLREKRRNGEPLVIRKWALTKNWAFTSDAEGWMLDAYDGQAPSAEVIEFFDTLVHDSRAGFLGGMEPYAYFRNRGIWESANRNPVVSDYEAQRRALQNQLDMHGIDFSGMR